MLTICPLTLAEANGFVASFHRHNKPVTLVVYVRLDNDPRSWNDDGVSTEFSGAVIAHKIQVT